MREIVKLGVVAAVILIAAVLIALFASGYISAFRPGGAKDSTTGEHVVGSSGGGLGRGVSVVSTPAPSPSPPGMPQMPESMAGPQTPGALPGGQPPLQAQPLQAPAGGDIYSQPIMPPAQMPVQPASPSQQGPSWPDQSGKGGSWFDSRVIQDRQQMPPIVGPTASPVPLPYEPGSEPFSWSPNEMGWMQIILRVVGILPFLFPGLSPVYTWWPGTA